MHYQTEFNNEVIKEYSISPQCLTFVPYTHKHTNIHQKWPGPDRLNIILDQAWKKYSTSIITFSNILEND